MTDPTSPRQTSPVGAPTATNREAAAHEFFRSEGLLVPPGPAQSRVFASALSDFQTLSQEDL